MSGPKPSRATKGRIRELIAYEMRRRMTEFPDYALGESEEVKAAWSDYVLEVARQISPEGPIDL